jgi:hypothetical protein
MDPDIKPRHFGDVMSIGKLLSLNIGELTNLTTKMITLFEFFNFVSEVSSLQYE